MAMPVMPRENEWTVDDLDLIPEDGLQWELLDGMLLVSPAPTMPHQRAVGNIYLLLRLACTAEFEVFVAPLDWRPDRRSSLQPDVLVVANEDVGVKNIERPLALAVEVLSPSTRRKDQVLKRSKYEDSGITSYWIVDPGAGGTPSIEMLDLVDGVYTTTAFAQGDEPAHSWLPFPVTVRPADLIRR